MNQNKEEEAEPQATKEDLRTPSAKGTAKPKGPANLSGLSGDIETSNSHNWPKRGRAD